MGALDIALLVVCVVAVVSAARRGFARAGIGTIFFWTGILAACWLYPVPGSFLSRWMPSKTATVVGFVVVLGTLVGLGCALGFFASKWVKKEQLNWLDHSLGAVFGVLDGAVLATLIVLLLTLPAHPIPERLIAKSYFAPPLTRIALAFSALLPEEVRERLERSYQDIRRASPVKLKDHIPEPPPPYI